MEKLRLLLIDFKNGVAGVEDVVSSGIHYWIHTTTEFAETGQFREVTETLASYATRKGEWNPQGFYGGTMTNSAIGMLAVVEAVFRRHIYESNIGETVEVGGAKYLVRPCTAALMPIRLWERHELPRRRAWQREERFGVFEARKLCFANRNEPKPSKVYFAKGTTSVVPPANSVARLGGSSSSEVVFLDKFARPIAAFKDAGGWNNPYAQPMPIPDRLDWRQLRSLGKSTRDILFGVHG
jgi:hypothetical protein